MTTRLGIIGFGVIMLLSGCAVTPTDVAVRDSVGGIATGSKNGKLYIIVDDRTPGGNGHVENVDKDKKFFVCNPYKVVCDEPASDKLYSIIESYGFNTTKDKKDYDYIIRISGFVSISPKKIGGDRESPAILVNAVPVLENDGDDLSLSPWINQELLKSDEFKKEMMQKGRIYQGLAVSNFTIYNSMYTQMGKTTQALSGGSSGGFLFGMLVGPILEAALNVKYSSEMREGFVSMHVSVIGGRPILPSATQLYAYVASDNDHSVRDMINVGLDTVLSRVKAQAYAQK
ncbi:hypothetical protein [Tepidiphilus sp. J10]|uniref:hypothetical protein n=1 Tax=Tepidiphilus sp. J10 TaxID=2502185 RepID=UPI00115EF67E|nr:hypothetical protein [Tepidiphilus sp. J10]